MKNFFIILLILILNTPSFSQEVIKNGCHRIRVYFNNESKDPFPGYWLDPPVNAFCTELPDSLHDKNLEILREELQKYPPKLLRKIKRVFVFDSLRFYGKNFGGTYYKHIIYYTDRGFSKMDIIRMIHHEFSSILLNRYRKKFDRRSWKDCLPDNFQYKSRGIDALMTPDADLNYNDSLNALGFLNKYAVYHFEEDFNSFAQHLWARDKEFWERLEQYPLLKEKAMLVISFYKSIAPELDEKFFSRIAGD